MPIFAFNEYYFILHWSIDNLLILVYNTISNNTNRIRLCTMQYSAVRCNWLQAAVQARNHATSLCSVLIATAHDQTVCWAAGETRDTGPGFKQTRGPDSLRDSGRVLLRACDFRERQPSAQSVQDSQSFSTRWQPVDIEKYLAGKIIFKSNLNFFPELKTSCKYPKKNFDVSCVETG